MLCQSFVLSIGLLLAPYLALSVSKFQLTYPHPLKPNHYTPEIPANRTDLVEIDGKPGCYMERNKHFYVEFCTNACFVEGACAGGVFKGIMFCTLATNKDCMDKFGLDRMVEKQVVVKFNEKGSEHNRDIEDRQLPATDTANEIAAMKLLSDEKHVVSFYGRLARHSGKVVKLKSGVGYKTFLTPGMVMEFLPGGSVAAALRKGKISEDELPCILEQATHAALAMIKNGFIHVDMHLANLVLTGSTYSSETIKCHFIKVIDYGYLKKPDPRSSVDPRLQLLGMFAVVMDRKYRGEQLSLSHNTVKMLKDFLKDLVSEGVDLHAPVEYIESKCKTREAFCRALLDLTRPTFWSKRS